MMQLQFPKTIMVICPYCGMEQDQPLRVDAIYAKRQHVVCTPPIANGAGCGRHFAITVRLVVETETATIRKVGDHVKLEYKRA